MRAPVELLETAQRRWPLALRAEVCGETIFPLGIPFGRPRAMSDFATLRREVETLAAARNRWRIDWEHVNTRRWGRQRIPIRVAFESIEDLAATLGRSDELMAFRTAVREARAACPALEPWLRAKADRIVNHLGAWRNLVAVCAHFDAHPRPGCYMRQLPVPGGTKFIEEHIGILREMLDVVLGDRVNVSGKTFAERFHLLTEPPRIRFRFLDRDLRVNAAWPVDDSSIPAPAFARLAWQIGRVLVVENRDVFLCLPNVPGTLAIFGSGKAASLLPLCAWLKTADIVYWGDCDEAGYGILSALRSSFPQVRSLLMDEEAWCRWRHLAERGVRDITARHTYLTEPERVALAAILDGPWRLEQERVPAADADRAVMAAFR